MSDETLDATDSSFARGRAGIERAFLVVYWGHESRSQILELASGASITFGRSDEATVKIDHEKVSRIHAKVVRRGAMILVEDLGSRNGTVLNGKRVEGTARIVAGDEIGIGPALVVVGSSMELQRRTSLASLPRLEERLVAEVDRARRYRRPVGLLMLRVDGTPEVADLAIERIADQLRRMDEIAEYATDEIAIVVPEADEAATTLVAARLSREALSAGVLVHVGLAVFPVHGAHAAELITCARAGLRAARRGHGSLDLAPVAPDAPVQEHEPVVVDERMNRLYGLVRRIAAAPIAVLVLGETGVGKELVAEAVHRHSNRARAPLVKINCASLPETLLESELFGHERGAFTGAERQKPGYFEAASGGTIFLDEVGEMPPILQAKLLRVLERRTITRVGGTDEIVVDVRIVTATNRDLDREVARGTFREDLYFRISAFTLVVPPLRDRTSEIIPLAKRFLHAFARELAAPPPSISDDVTRALRSYSWPGNVRELKNAVERAFVLQVDGQLELEHLPDRIRLGASSDPDAQSSFGVRARVEQVERAALVEALAACNGNQTHAAKSLGLSRRALIYRLEKLGLKSKPGSG